MIRRRAVYFTGPREAAVREEYLPEPEPGMVLVETLLSAVSTGSELLAYRGDAPHDMSLDVSISSLQGRFSFPFKYGYSAVGKVLTPSHGVDDSRTGGLVFCFQPHQSHFTARPDDLFPAPAGMKPEDAVFLSNMETAVNLVMDGRPAIGESVLVLGQGIVGLLTTRLLSGFPLGALLAVDAHPLRREASVAMGGAHCCLDPADPETPARLAAFLEKSGGADLVYELSGNPAALNAAVASCGFGGRIVVGSWYGRKEVRLDLGSRFHRERLKIVSSQVSTLSPEFAGRWNKARRMDVAWRAIERARPSRLITRRVPVEQAAEAYRMLDADPSRHLQVVFTYGAGEDAGGGDFSPLPGE